MTTLAYSDRDILTASGRLAVYSLLATGFSLPTAERLRHLDTTLLPAVGGLRMGSEIDDAVVEVIRSFSPNGDLLRKQHGLLFPPIASQDAPGYETGYRGEDIFGQTALMADAAGFYRAHGLRAGGSEKERPDHIAVELDFMAFMAQKEVLALRNGVEEHVDLCREATAMFLTDHLGCWGPGFGRRTMAVSTSHWYASLGLLLALWLEEDMASMGVHPLEAASQPLPQDPPDDGGCGPCPTPGFGSI